MWFATRWTTRSRTARGERSRSRNSPASSAPTASWRRKWPSAKVDGLPMSWSSAASRTTGRPGRRRIDRSERVVPEVLALDLVLRHAALRRERPARCRPAGPCPRAAAARPTALGAPAACRARSRSARRRGAGPARPAPGCRPASPPRRRTRASLPAARPGPSGARPPRSAAAARRRRAGRAPGCRPRPSYGSTSPGEPAAAATAPHAIALTVKSRRARSASMVSPNSTRCGRRKSA